MYSTYIEDTIEVLNPKELKKVKENLDTSGLINDGGSLDFANWCGHKLEGYWYESTRKILRAIAPHIKGYVEFSYEEGYPFRLEFRNGKIFYKRGAFEWNELEEEELK